MALIIYIRDGHNFLAYKKNMHSAGASLSPYPRGRMHPDSPKSAFHQPPLRLARPVSQEHTHLFDGVRCRVCGSKLGYFKSEKVSCWECGEPVCDLHCKFTRITKSSPKTRRWCRLCQISASRAEIRSQLEAEITQLNLRTIQTKEECDVRSRVAIDVAGTLRKTEESFREMQENAAKTAEKQAESDRKEAEKQTNARKELAFYDEQQKILKTRKEMLLEAVTKSEWRLQTFDSERRDVSLKQIALLGQLEEADRRVKMTIPLRKLKEKVCEMCRNRLNTYYQEERRPPVSMPISLESDYRKPDEEQSKCSLL